MDESRIDELLEKLEAIERRLGVLERVEALLTKFEPLIERYLNNPAARFKMRGARDGR